MKFNTKRSGVEREGIKTEKNFTISTTAHAFDILSSGLYSDKILAVVRELSCNAYDAHVDAKKKSIPFEIHLPNRLEPWFSVKDNGVGLSEKDTLDLYTTYFGSTKRESNEVIGAFGLGSKSPFSYTDAFDVSVRYDGMIKFYAIFTDEEGVPTIAKLSEMKTDDCNGLEVKLTVDQNDFADFKQKTKDALKYFDVKPTITGDDFFTWDLDSKDSIVEGKGWHAIKGDWNARGMIAIQGNVPYQVNIDLIDNLSSQQKELLRNSKMIVNFEIGELAVTPSREALQYNDATVANLKSKIEIVIEGVKKHVMKTANKHKRCYWDAAIALRKISNTMFGSTKALADILSATNLKNKTLEKFIDTKGSFQMHQLELKGHELLYYTASSYSAGGRASRSTLNGNFTPDVNDLLTFNDLKMGGVSRISKCLNEGKYDGETCRRIIVVKRKLKDDSGFNFEKEYKSIIKFLGGPTFMLVSDLPASDSKTSAGTYVDIKKYFYNPIERETQQSRWNSKKKIVWERVIEDVDVDKGGIYFLLNNRKYITRPDGRTMTAGGSIEHRLDEAHNLLSDKLPKKHKNICPKIHGVSSRLEKILKKKDNWFNMYDLLAKAGKKYKDVAGFNARIASTNQMSNSGIFNDLTSAVGIIELKKRPDSDIKTLLLGVVEGSKRVRDTKDMMELFGYFDINIEDGKKSKPFLDVNKLIEKHPLLQYLSIPYQDRDREEYMKHVIDYIMNTTGGKL